MIQMAVDEIKRLSQEEGLNDGEIAARLGISRATVNRHRQAADIPRANLKNRRDKSYECKRCGRTVVIARKERCAKYCPACKPIVTAENIARKQARAQAKKASRVA